MKMLKVNRIYAFECGVLFNQVVEIVNNFNWDCIDVILCGY